MVQEAGQGGQQQQQQQQQGNVAHKCLEFKSEEVEVVDGSKKGVGPGEEGMLKNERRKDTDLETVWVGGGTHEGVRKQSIEATVDKKGSAKEQGAAERSIHMIKAAPTGALPQSIEATANDKRRAKEQGAAERSIHMIKAAPTGALPASSQAIRGVHVNGKANVKEGPQQLLPQKQPQQLEQQHEHSIKAPQKGFKQQQEQQQQDLGQEPGAEDGGENSGAEEDYEISGVDHKRVANHKLIWRLLKTR